MSKNIYILIMMIFSALFLLSCATSKPETTEKPQAEQKTDIEAQTPSDTNNPSPSEPNNLQPEQPRPEKPVIKAIPEPNKPPQPNEPEPMEKKLPKVPEKTIDVNDPNTTPKEPKQEKPEKKWKGTTFHKQFAPLLKEYVRKDGMVDYDSLRHNKPEFTRLLYEFNHLSRDEYNSWRKNDKIAFWINAYNLKMLNIIIDNYPIQASRWLTPFWGPYSIRHIDKIWTKYKFMIMDEQFNLLEIEKSIFSEKFKDPRVFLAIYQASYSSPPLRNEPYYGYKLDEQLDEQIKKYLNSPQGLKIESDSNKVYISAIFDSTWRGREFIEKYKTSRKFKDKPTVERAVLNFICEYLPENQRRFLEVGNYNLEYIRYDWTLNDTSVKR